MFRYYWILGGGICLVVIMFCLFPLWPKVIRKGSQWLATVAVGFLVAVLVVGVLKYFLFTILYILSARKFRLEWTAIDHKNSQLKMVNNFRFWILPNLTKDVGFIGSFWPLYEYSYTGEYIGDVAEDNDPDEKPPVCNDSDSNESGKSGFEFVEKNKDD